MTDRYVSTVPVSVENRTVSAVCLSRATAIELFVVPKSIPIPRRITEQYKAKRTCCNWWPLWEFWINQSCQKMYFNENCMSRGSAAVRIWPKPLAPKTVFGSPGLRLFVTLKASNRASSF
jgi:hypothetical protein